MSAELGFECFVVYFVAGARRDSMEEISAKNVYDRPIEYKTYFVDGGEFSNDYIFDSMKHWTRAH